MVPICIVHILQVYFARSIEMIFCSLLSWSFHVVPFLMWSIFVNVDQDSFLISLFIALFCCFPWSAQRADGIFLWYPSSTPPPHAFYMNLFFPLSLIVCLCSSVWILFPTVLFSVRALFWKEHWLVMIKRDRTLLVIIYCLLVLVILSACSM